MALPFLLPSRGSAVAREWRVRGIDVPELSSFDRTIEDYMRLRNIKSGALAVTNNGRLVLARGYCWDDEPDMAIEPTSLFRIASISKPITAAAIMQLVERAGLSLSTPLTALVSMEPPRGQQLDSRLGAITLSHLLQHLGGWDRDRSFDPMFIDATVRRALGTGLPVQLADIITYMSGQRLDSTPGSAHAYSNFGYALLGKVIERVANSGYEAWVRNAVLAPLGIGRMRQGRTLLRDRAAGEVKYESTFRSTSVMDGSGASVPYPYGGFNCENMAAHGNWLASAVDLVRFATAFDQPGQSPILSAASIDQTFALPPLGMQSGGWYYGLGWYVRPGNGGRRNTWHFGSLPGTTTLLVRRFDGLNWAAVFNQRDDPNDPRSTTYLDIDASLHTAANAVLRWPTHDLFGTYLG
jgi:CubicO group peptidase (beta-lactamase class C family)